MNSLHSLVRRTVLFTPVALAATLSFGGSAFAQTNPNALGIWRSDDYTKLIGLNNGAAVGATGNHIWTILPPDVLTYFKPQPSGARELDFRGLCLLMRTPGGTAKAHTVPIIEIRKAVQAAAPNEGRYLPDLTAQGLLLSFNKVNLGTIAANNTVALSYLLPFAVTFPTGSPTSVAMPAGTPAGQGLALRVVDYQSQYGGGTNGSLMFLVSTTETPWAADQGPLSGVTIAGTGSFWMDQLVAGTTPLTSHEWCFTFLFDQSLVVPIKNAVQLQGGAAIPNGGTLPTSLDPLNGGFAIQADDGRGALAPKPGDVLSFAMNSNMGAKLGPAAVGSAWLVPFMFFEGDALPTDPLPENWVGQGGTQQLSYIYPMPLQTYLNDFGSFIGIPQLGTFLNPNNSTLGLWLGVDLANNYLNFNALVNGFGISDITNGVSFGGPETKMFDTTTNPTGQMARNLVKFGTRIGELKSLSVPQTGWTPVVTSTNPAFIGMEYPVLVPNTLAGKGFYITCWVMDVASPTNPFIFNILDVTSVLKFTMQN
jgi:hypothetical protein